MNSFLWIAAALCALVYLFNKCASSEALKQTLAQRQRQFVIDVCDGDRQQAERLITEKTHAYPGLGASHVLQLVYQDMLELTAEERAAAYAAPAGYTAGRAVNGSAA